MNDLINNLTIAVSAISAVVALSSLTGLILSHSLKRKGFVLERGAIISTLNKTVKKEYLKSIRKYTPEMLHDFTNNATLQDFETELNNLEYIPSGRVKKLFLSGRGSWRVTCGNILSKTGFDCMAEKEYSQML